MLRVLRNYRRLNKRIENIKFTGNKVIAFDFDEFLIEENLTAKIIRMNSQQVNESLLKKINPNSFHGLLYLNALMDGVNYDYYSNLRDKVAEESKWRQGLSTFLKNLSKENTVIVISSGMKDICEAKLKEINFERRNILANEFAVKRGRILGSEVIVTDELKGYIIRKLKKRYFTIAAGHSRGDKYMLRDAHRSVALNPDSPGLAEISTNDLSELQKIILNFINERKD